MFLTLALAPGPNPISHFYPHPLGTELSLIYTSVSRLHRSYSIRHITTDPYRVEMIHLYICITLSSTP